MLLRRLVPLLLVLAAPLFAAAPPGKQPPRLKLPRPMVDPRPLVESNNRFALDLYKQLRTGEGNLFYSPSSIASALTLASAGAAGKTREQMATTLHTPSGAMDMMATLDDTLQSRTNKAVQLRSISRVWVDESMKLNPAFADALERAGARVKLADFRQTPEVGRKMVNIWTAWQSNNHIPELLPAGSITPLTRVVVASGVHFKADWANKFKVEKTVPGEFHTPRGKVTVPLMKQFSPFVLGEMDSGPVLEMPYAGEQLSLILAMPGDGKKLSDVEQDVIEGKLEAAVSKGIKQKVEVILPKFKMLTSLQLPATLRAMGMDDAFGPTADFSGIDGSRDLYLSGVFHKAALEVTEEGSEATAATGIVISARSKVTFHATQPFVFAIRDKGTGSLLFLGRVVDPK